NAVIDRVEVPFREAREESALVERHDVDGDSGLTQLLLQHRHHSCANAFCLRKNREPRRLTARILEDSIAIAVSEAGSRKEFAATDGIVLTRRTHISKPRPIRRRHRSVNRNRRTEIDGIHERLSIDDARHGLAKGLLLKQTARRLLRMHGREIEPEKIWIEPQS